MQGIKGDVESIRLGILVAQKTTSFNKMKSEDVMRTLWRWKKRKRRRAARFIGRFLTKSFLLKLVMRHDLAA